MIETHDKQAAEQKEFIIEAFFSDFPDLVFRTQLDNLSGDSFPMMEIRYLKNDFQLTFSKKICNVRQPLRAHSLGRFSHNTV